MAMQLMNYGGLARSIMTPCLQVILPDGYLSAVYEEMRAEGAACIADEVSAKAITFALEVMHTSTFMLSCRSASRTVILATETSAWQRKLGQGVWALASSPESAF